MAEQNVFQIDYSQTTQALMPPSNRTPIHFAWLSCLANPLQNDHNYRFNTYVPLLFKQAHYNSQKIVLTQILNDLVGAVSAPLIYIVNNSGATNSEAFIFNESENEDTCYIYNEDEGQDTTYIYNITEELYMPDFTVYVPETYYNSSQDLIKANVRQYAIAGVSYQIDSY